ncbi:MAG: hypothetical protein KA053_00510 [Lentimicrobiaceae bacterium]|nr:hypothetical protein [Lentimicrobiaceae bacterium]
MKKPLLFLSFMLCLSHGIGQQVTLEIRAFLQGPYTGIESMSTDLNAAGLLPLQQPYQGAPWHYSGTETLASAPAWMVDWVLIELRTHPDTAVMRKAVLLGNDGRVRDLNGSLLVSMAVPSRPYFVVLMHRNHLPVMTDQPLPLPSAGIIDLAGGGGFVMKSNGGIDLGGGIMGLVAGDVSHDMKIKYSGQGNDRSLILQRIVSETGSTAINATLNGYYDEDVDLNGVVKYSGSGNDASRIIQNLVMLTGTTAINSVFTSPVPPAVLIAPPVPVFVQCGDMYTDPRDGRAYPTVLIGNQCWMGQNLNTGVLLTAGQTFSDNDTIEKRCFNDDSLLCAQSGGLYQWDEMMAYAQDEQSRGICPPDWRLPTDADWYALEHFVDPVIADPLLFGWRGMIAGMHLQLPGMFHAMLGGQADANGVFDGLMLYGKYWSTSRNAAGKAIIRGFDMMHDGVLRDSSVLDYARSVRCIYGDPLRIRPGIVIIDTTQSLLLSDSIMQGQGLYVFEHIGQDTLVLDTGMVFIGVTGGGYLRKVVQVLQTSPLLQVQTEQATLEDVFIDAEFGTDFFLNSAKDPKLISSGFSYLANGVIPRVGKGGLSYDFSNTILYQNGPLTITIDTGYFTFDPNFVFKFKYKSGRVQRLAFYTENALFEHQIDIGMYVTQASTLMDYDQTIATYKWNIFFMVGYIPVIIEVKADLHAVSKASFDAALNATFGYKDSKNFSIGAIYEYEQWKKVFDYQSNFEVHPFTWGGQVHFRQYAALIPKVSVKLYGVAGPYMTATAYDSLRANVAFPSFDWDAVLQLGLNASIGAEVTVCGSTLANYSQQLFAYDTNIWESPYRIQIISGDEQVGEAGEMLSVPVKVKVTDNIGQCFLPVPVHFSVASGGGSLADTVVYTTPNGYAQTYWTLGDQPGQQALSVQVRRADSTQIQHSPLTFTAVAFDHGPALQPCPGLDSVIFDGQTYHTVQIGTQCWMNRNLDAGVRINTGQNASDNGIMQKYCYADDETNCLLYGGLYNWSEAMAYTTAEGSQGICPQGWHIPSDGDWKRLEGYADSIYGIGDGVWDSVLYRGYDAGWRLKASSGWGLSGNGIDHFGLRVFPGGNRVAGGQAYQGLGQQTLFWTSNESGSASSWYRMLDGSHSSVYRNTADKSLAAAIRCLRDTSCSPLPDTAYAGPDQLNLGGNAAIMAANQPVNGTGYWSVYSGSGGSFLSHYSPFTKFTGQYGSTYVLIWTISNFCGANSDTVVISFAPYVYACGDTFVDTRNNMKYPTKLIGSQCWMMRNLNIGTMISGPTQMANNGVIEKYCLDNQSYQCDYYGGLYQWTEAMQYSTTAGAQGICPSGWHIPTDEEWKALEGNADSYYGVGSTQWDIFGWRGLDAGTRLKSTYGWLSGVTGTDVLGFKVLPVGYRLYNNGTFAVYGHAAYFWTSNEVSNNAWYRHLLTTHQDIKRDYAYKTNGFSVRCLKN